MSETVDLSDETIEKLADALKVRLSPPNVGTPIYSVPPYYFPNYPNYAYPYVTSLPNSGSVTGSSEGVQVYNG